MRVPFRKPDKDNAPRREGRERKSLSKNRESDGLTSTPAIILAPRLMFIGAVVVLCVFGLIMIYSASSIESYASADFGNDSMYFFKKQLMWLGIGGVFCLVAAFLPHRTWANPPVAWGLWLLTIILLIMVIAALGVKSLGAERSLSFGGMSIQPAEFAKISVMLLMASLLERYRNGELDVNMGRIQMAAIVAITAILIYKQPDLGTMIILAVGITSVLVLYGIPLRWLIFIAGILAIYVIFSCITQPYHFQRIMTLFNPWEDMQGNAYQTTQGFMAFGSGGIFGTGLGLSRQKYLYLPYAYNDFIFAVVGEELGLVGAMFLVLVFLVLIFAGLRICRTAPDIFGCMVAGGFTCMIGFQAYVNMACVVGVFPVTGKALPFISYGGSSLLATMIMAGLVLGVSKDSRLDVQSEARRDNLVVMDGGRATRQQQQGRGSNPAPAGFGGFVAGIGGAVGSVAERFSGSSRQQGATGGAGSRARGNQQRNQQPGYQSGRQASQRGSQRSGGRVSGTGYGSSRQNDSRQSGYRDNSRNAASHQQQQGSARRSSRRRSDLDVELVDIAPKIGRPERDRNDARRGSSSSNSARSSSRSSSYGSGRGSSRQSTGARKAPSSGSSSKKRVSYGDAAKRTRNDRRR